MNCEVVLGVEFMQKFSCVLDMESCIFTTDDLVINFFMKENMSWYRITAADTVSIPSNHEIQHRPGRRR